MADAIKHNLMASSTYFTGCKKFVLVQLGISSLECIKGCA